MPHTDGVFRPAPWRPLEHPLFDVLPPDHPESTEPATEDDHEWYQELVTATAELLVFLVENVRRNFTQHRGVSFNRAQVAGLTAHADRVARLLDDHCSRASVTGQMSRLAKQRGLVRYNTHPGPRADWPMARREVLSQSEAEEIVHRAFWDGPA